MAAVTGGSAEALRAAARATGVLEDDPLAVLVEALADAVQRVTAGQDDLASSTNNAVARLGTVLTLGRDTATAEANRFRAEMAASEVDVVRRVGRAIADAADAGLARRGRALDRRTSVSVALALVLASVVGGATGWWGGRDVGRREVEGMVTDMRNLFRQEPDAKGAWLDIMQWNDLRAALQSCREPGGLAVQAGRKFCRVPLWLSRPTVPLP